MDHQMALEFKRTWWICLLFMAILITVGQAASSTTNLTCYLCHTLNHGALCQHVFQNVQLVESLPKRRCVKEETHCMVRRFAFAPNGTDTKVWMMERNCTSSCTNECVITGDRMKLHLCTSCCKNNLCNVDNGASGMATLAGYLSLNLVVVFLNNALQRSSSQYSL